MKAQNTAATKEEAANSIPPSLRDFDSLPDSAHVRQPVVEALFACSPASVWRRVKAQTLPAPLKFSKRVTTWNVGELRRALANPSSGGEHAA